MAAPESFTNTAGQRAGSAAEPWRGFAARPRGADVAFVAFVVLVLPGAAAAGLLWPEGAVALALLLGGALAGGASTAGPPWLLRHARSWYPVFAVPALYALVPALNTALHGGAMFDAVVQQWEAAVFGGQPSRTWSVRAPWLPLSELLHAAYLAYYPLIFVPPMLLHMRGERRGFEVVISTFAIVSVLHLLAFTWFPVEGPRYRFPAPDAGRIEEGLLYQFTHRVLEAGSSRGAAFPSAHVGVAAAQAVLAWRWLPRLAPWITLVALLLSVATVYGGFHYLLDALAGALIGGGVALIMLRQHGRESHSP